MKKSFIDLRNLIIEAEHKKENLILEKLSYNLDDLSPVLSKKNLEFHYKILAKGYVDRFNNEANNLSFNKAGAVLHNIFFSQFKSPSLNNKPIGAILVLIEKYFKNFKNFRNELDSKAMSIQGSGWIYLSTDGKIKIINNHEIFNDIVLLIDWWEHAWFTDYGPDKQTYLNNLWRIINWTVINDRINIKNI